MKRGTFQCFVAAAATLAATAVLSRPFFDPRADKRDAIDADAAFAAEPRDPACYAAKFVSTGGLAPHHPHTLAVRWAGYSNFELAYNGKIILLDAYFDRGGNYPPLHAPDSYRNRAATSRRFYRERLQGDHGDGLPSVLH